MDLDRREWLFPRRTGMFDGIDLSLLDPEREDDRAILVLAEHPELAGALEDEEEELDVTEPSPRSHLAIHEVVANQIWSDDPPETWATAKRLIDLGYEHHDVVHMLGSVVAAQLWRVIAEQQPLDRERFAAELATLPESWWEDEDDEDDLTASWPPSGVTFTHRLVQAEVDLGALAWSADLEPLRLMMEDHGHLHLVDDRVAELEHTDEVGQVLAGPPGWLDPFDPGDVVGLRVVDGEVALVAVDATTTAPGFGEALRGFFDRANEGDGMPILAAELLNGVLHELAEPLAGPLPPVGELLEEHGFEVHDAHAAPVGTNWTAFSLTQAVVNEVVRRGLGPTETQAVMVAVEFHRLVVAGAVEVVEADREIVRGIGTVLADADVAEAFVDVTLATGESQDVVAFAEGLLPLVRRGDRAGVAWVAAAATRRGGDHARAEAMLRRALEFDAGHPLAVEDAAWYASDRGDARKAVELLGRLDRDDAVDLRASALRPYAGPAPRPLARRNDPCPCGSGRKFKHCCAGTPRQVPLVDRVGWIWIKLVWFLSRSGLVDDVDDVEAALDGNVVDGEYLAASLVLFEEGAVEMFLVQRGPLLPDDERSLVARWALVECSVYEVTGGGAGVGMTLRDTRTGDVVEVRDHLGSTDAALGDLLLAHVVPDGHTHQMVGGVIRVPPHLRDPLTALLDEQVPAVDLAEWLGVGVLSTGRVPPRICGTR